MMLNFYVTLQNATFINATSEIKRTANCSHIKYTIPNIT